MSDGYNDGPLWFIGWLVMSTIIGWLVGEWYAWQDRNLKLKTKLMIRARRVGKIKGAVYLLPKLVVGWWSFDPAKGDIRARTINIGLGWLLWFTDVTISLTTVRPWQESRYWRDHPEELEALLKSQERQTNKMANRAAQRAMSRVKV